MKNVIVISNFDAGRRKALKYKKEVQKFLLNNAESFKFISLDELSSQDMKKYDTILIMGGDGTINKVLPYLDDTGVLGIIPCGTANLLAARLGIPANIKKALKIIKQETVFETDVLNINDRDCVLRCGIGYDSNIICRTPQKLKNNFGYFAYFAAGILFALRLKNKEYNIKTPEIEKNINSSCIIIANAPNMFHNFVSVGNKSELNDKKFEVFILKTANPILFFIEFLLIILNIKRNNSRAEYFQTNSISISSKYFNIHIDGENCKEHDNISCKIKNSRIKIFKKP